MTPTMRDVARHAGVSVKTVSRVVNGEPHVTAAVRERVLEVVAELGHRVNTAAQSLRTVQRDVELTAIPYADWGNRAAGPIRVWVPLA